MARAIWRRPCWTPPGNWAPLPDILQIMLQPHAIVDANVPLALAEGDVRLEEVRFAYPERAAVLED